MSIKVIILAGYSFFLGLTKEKLIDVIMSVREEYTQAQAQIRQLKGHINKLKDENTQLKQALKQQQIKAVNKAANKPSSKQAEWEAKGNQTDHPDEGEEKNKKKKEKGHGKKENGSRKKIGKKGRKSVKE